MKKLLPYLILAGVMAGLGYALGAGHVLVSWEQDKKIRQAEHSALVKTLAAQREQHEQKQQEIANELAEARERHVVAVSRQRNDFEQRLLQSTRRAAVYRRQAEAGAAAQRDLASHAARLDRALEEGRELVGELGATLRLRDSQLILLGDQLRNDRRLLEGQP